jgi:hypothetical protein
VVNDNGSPLIFLIAPRPRNDRSQETDYGVSSLKETFATIAALLAIAGNIPYVLDVFRGKVKPHTYTWFVWTLVSAIVFFGQLAKGAGVGAIPTAASEVFTLIIFLLSLKYGYRRIKWADTLFLLLALIGIVCWVLTKDPTLSIVIAVSIDVVAFIPTLRKTWEEPGTETPILFSANVVRHVLALFSMEAYNIATMLHSIAMIAMNSLMTALILLNRKNK